MITFTHKTSLFIFIFIFIFSVNSIAATGNKVSTAKYVDIAGQQRMLAHQALVAYSQIGQIQSFGNPVDLKVRAIKQFESNLKILEQNPGITPLTQKLNTTWAEFKGIILKTPDKQQMPVLIILNEQLLEMSNNIIAELLKGSDSKKDVVNISGQQRMLSQRIALFMLIENWGVDKDYSKQFTDSLNKFASNLMQLKSNPNNTSSIEKKLASVEKDYKQLIILVYKDKKERDYSFSISRLTSQILRKAKRSTKLYVKLKEEQ
jgi:nitrate/nitrite-specific signal transduction histidine kinase